MELDEFRVGLKFYSGAGYWETLEVQPFPAKDSDNYETSSRIVAKKLEDNPEFLIRYKSQVGTIATFEDYDFGGCRMDKSIWK